MSRRSPTATMTPPPMATAVADGRRGSSVLMVSQARISSLTAGLHLPEPVQRRAAPPGGHRRRDRVFSDFVLGYSALDAGLAALDPATRHADLMSWEVEYRTLPADQYPNIAAVAHALPSVDDPENFTLALELTIEAIRARAAAPNRP